MTEAEAREQVRQLVGDDATQRLERLATAITAENERQNLIARSTVATIWSRHILDSIQLLAWAEGTDGPWIDIGTGGGFPGLAVAVATRRAVVLVEPRRQRAAFLAATAAEFGLAATQVVQARVEQLAASDAAVISARAVAALGDLFEGASHCSSPTTRWLLPRGAGWQNDVAVARTEWKGMFHVEHSLSDPAARIVIATQIERR